MKAKNVVLVLAATGLISSQALAAEAGVKGVSSTHTQATFTEADASTLFETSGKPMQVASLSSTEMKDTRGAVAPVVAAAATIGAGALGGGIGYAASVPAHQRTWSGWATAVGSGAVGGAVGLATPVIPTAAFWGMGIGVGGGYVANRISTP